MRNSPECVKAARITAGAAGNVAFNTFVSPGDAIIAPVLNIKNTAPPDGRRPQANLLVGAACGLLLVGHVQALGLGGVSGQAVIGQPLRIEIPLLGTEGGLPAADCFRIRAPSVEMEQAYVLKGGRVEVVGERGRARLVVTAAPVREPIVEFAVNVACGFDLTKDYLLLSSVPAKPAEAVSPPLAVPAAAVPAVAAIQPAAAPAKSAAPAAPAAAPSAGSLRVTAETTFEALAQRNYPLQPKAREKYARMMRAANPGVGDAIAAGTELRVPAGLPVRREGPYRPEAVAPKPAVAIVAAEAPRPPAKPAKAAPAKDVLRLGVAPERTNAELLAEAERLTGVLIEQARMEDEIAENLTRLETAFKDLQQQYVAVEDRLARIEAERQAEKAAQSQSFGFVGLLAAVLAGGALGGAGLHFYNRRRRLPDPAAERFDAPTVAAYLGPEEAPKIQMPKPKPETASLSFTGDK